MLQGFDPEVNKDFHDLLALVIVNNDGDFGDHLEAEMFWYSSVVPMNDVQYNDKSIEVPATRLYLAE